ncbi:MAG TPA: hypothetical protein VHY35_08050 [Stellaceae bacterium]|nr:hypothetical protein [Stellaceae bacterium]
MALSPIADDPRVRRQADAFHKAGWEVVAVGVPGGRSSAPDWPVLTRDDLPPPPPPEPIADADPQRIDVPRQAVAPTPDRLPLKSRLLTAYRDANRYVPISAQNWSRLEAVLKIVWGRSEYFVRFGGAVVQIAARQRFRAASLRPRPFGARLKPPPRVAEEAADQLFWKMSRDFNDIYTCAETVDASIWLANDWTMLPIAARLASEKGGSYGYDSHEFATEEYAENLTWRLTQRPIVCAIEERFVRGAAIVSAVSSGIAESLDRLYGLPRPSLVIRNMPAFEEAAFRPTAPDRIRVLYHGIVAPNRGLEAAIDSVAAWRPEFDLTIRGPGDAAFLDALRERIKERGLSGRAQLVPPVPMTALVREATEFDIGFFALPGHSPHNQFALPNKFFEYAMAGLALCTTELPEMARLIRQYDLGVTFPGIDPATIAEQINALQPEQIDQYKRNALAAARELCWDRESERLVNAYSAVLVRAGGEG